MAEIRRRRTVIAAKVEATVGTSETLTASECLVLVYDAKFDATIPMFDRKLMDASTSPFTPIPGTQMAKVTFKLEIKGSGTAGTAPALGLFLKACGMAETLVALTSATYAPISAAYPALTMAVYTVKNSRFTPGRHCRISPFLQSNGAWRVVELFGIGWCFGVSRMARWYWTKAEPSHTSTYGSGSYEAEVVYRNFKCHGITEKQTHSHEERRLLT